MKTMGETGTHITHSDDETFALGEQLGEQLQHGAVLLLSGDLGAGKTVFTKGLAAGLEIDPLEVTSPSFTLINEHQGRLKLYHIDLYRLDEGAAVTLGLEEILEAPGAVVVIEWAERLGFVPPAATRVNLEYLDDTRRRITIHRDDADDADEEVKR